MAVLEIVRMGNPVLRTKARKLTPSEIRSPEITQLILDMIETMHAVKGIGLAAPQVNHSIQLAIIEIDASNPRYQDVGIPKTQPLLILANPKVKVLDHKLQGFWEGCLSVPGLRGFVRRPRKVQIDYLDENAQKKRLVASGFLATVFQHELDHLSGTLYLDKIQPRDRYKLSFLEEFQQFWTQDTKVD